MTTQQWARYALNGNTTATTPDDPTLAPLVASVTRDFTARYPCITPDPETGLSGDDLERWHEWAGYTVASRYLLTPAGGAFVTTATSIKVGPVEKKTAGSADIPTLRAAFETAAENARIGIACMNPEAPVTGRKQPISLFGRGGYRTGLERRRCR